MVETAVQHAFLSYVHESAEAVEKLASVLTAAGIPVWKDTEALWPGEDWKQKIRSAIEDGSLAFIACFSMSSVSKTKTFMNEELALAIDQFRLRPPGHVWLLPVRLDDCDLPDYDLGGGRTLNSLQRIDLFGPNREANLARLVAAIMGIFGTSTTSPATIAAAIATTNDAERGPRLAEELKLGMTDPTKTIETEELFLGEVKRVIEALKDQERFPLGGGAAPSVVTMVERAQEYDQLVAPLAHAAVTLGAWGAEDHAYLVTRAMSRIAAVTNAVQGGFTALIHLREYALLPVMYAGVIGAVARRNGRMVRAFTLDPQVDINGRSFPLAAATSPWRPFQESDVAASVLARVGISGGTIEERLAEYQQGAGKFYTPISEHLFRQLRPLAEPFVLDEQEYEQLFNRTEGFIGMSELDFAANSDGVPEYRRGHSHWIGRIGHAERYLDEDAGLAPGTVRDVQEQRERWWPLLGGMFGSDWQRAEVAASAWRDNVLDARRRRF